MATQSQCGIVLKSRREIELMRTAGALVHVVLARMEELAHPGATTAELNAVAEKMIADAGARALFKGVKTPQARIAFPAALCTSVNEEVVHGVPSDRALRPGDIVSIDCGVLLNGYCGDAALTIAVGEVAAPVRHLMAVTRQALDLAIKAIRPGLMWSRVAGRIQAYVEGEGLSVVREFVGHGIGQEMHEEPKVPNFVERRQKKADFRLAEGMTLAIEPMVTLGGPEVCYAGKERWAVCTKDGRPAAHYEHTVAVTADGAEVLTNGRR